MSKLFQKAKKNLTSYKKNLENLTEKSRKFNNFLDLCCQPLKTVGILEKIIENIRENFKKKFTFLGQ